MATPHLFKSTASAGKACLGGVAFSPPIGCTSCRVFGPKGPVLQPTSTVARRRSQMTAMPVRPLEPVVAPRAYCVKSRHLPSLSRCLGYLRGSGPARYPPPFRTCAGPACRPSALARGPSPGKCQLPEPAGQPELHPSNKSPRHLSSKAYTMLPGLALHKRHF